MLASYFLSRTLVPTLVKYLLQGARARRAGRARRRGRFAPLPARRSSSGSSALRAALPPRCSRAALERRRAFVVGVLRRLRRLASPRSIPWLGQDFFPTVDAGQIRLHVRARTGTRIEETARLCDAGRPASIRETIPPRRARDASSTTSACPTAASTSPTATGARSARPTPTSSSRSRRTTARPTAYVQRAARAARRAQFPGRHLLLPARRHRQPDPELRPAGADRRPGRRATTSTANRAVRRAAAAEDPRTSPAPSTCASSSRSTARSCASTSTAPRPQQVGYTQRDVASNLLVALSRQLPDVADASGSTRRPASATASPSRRRSTGIDSLAGPAEHPGHRHAGARAAAPRQPRHDHARRASRARVTHYNVAARHRHLRRRARARDLGSVARRRRRASSTRAAEGPAARHADRRARPGPRPCETSFAGLLGGSSSRSCSSTC